MHNTHSPVVSSAKPCAPGAAHALPISLLPLYIYIHIHVAEQIERCATVYCIKTLKLCASSCNDCDSVLILVWRALRTLSRLCKWLLTFLRYCST